MMGNVALVMLTVLLLQLLLAGAWLVGSWALDLPVQPARHWCASALLGALAMVMVLTRETLNTSVAVGLSNVVMVLTVLALLRGMRLFLGLSPRNGESLAVLAAALASGMVVAVLPPPWAGQLQAASTSLLLLLMFGHAAWQGGMALRAEFNGRVAAMLVMPLAVAGAMAGLRLVGVFLVPSRPIQVDTPLHVAVALVLLMAVLSVHGAMAAMVVLRLVARLRRLSQHDALTGLLNRAEWVRRLQAQHRWLGRFGDGFALLMLDIDHFKRFNDTWGHAAGDAVLVAVAQVLTASARPLDVVGRLGGEEFVLLLPRIDAEAAAHAAERLRQQLADLQISWQRHALHPTVSIGLAWCGDAGELPAQTLERADQALYQAKRSGRNRVVVAAAPPAM